MPSQVFWIVIMMLAECGIRSEGYKLQRDALCFKLTVLGKMKLKYSKAQAHQLNFLFFDWLFSKYAESIENVHCTPSTAPRLREELLVRDCERERHIDRSIFSLGKVVNILHV